MLFQVEVTDGKPGKLLVYLDRLVQKNKRSSSEKRIRCCLLDETKDGELFSFACQIFSANSHHECTCKLQFPLLKI